MTDLYSKWHPCEIKLQVHSQSVKHVLNQSTRNPEAFLSDQGPNVDGTEIHKALSELGIGKLGSSPYHRRETGRQSGTF